MHAIAKDIVTQMQGTTTRCCLSLCPALNDLILSFFLSRLSIPCLLTSFCLQGVTLAAKSTMGWQNIVSFERMPTLFSGLNSRRYIELSVSVCIGKKHFLWFLYHTIMYTSLKLMLDDHHLNYVARY